MLWFFSTGQMRGVRHRVLRQSWAQTCESAFASLLCTLLLEDRLRLLKELAHAQDRGFRVPDTLPGVGEDFLYAHDYLLGIRDAPLPVFVSPPLSHHSAPCLNLGSPRGSG